MILSDTHCHLYLEQFSGDLPQVLDRAAEAGVRHIWLPAIDPGSIRQMERLSHPRIRFYRMAGLHPCSVADLGPVREPELEELAAREEIVAIGETGLDYYWSREKIAEQKENLRIHCRVARQTRKPVVLHNRDSTSDLLDLVESEQDGRLAGVWHCFTGSIDEAQRALDLGLFLGIGGVLTFRNGGIDRFVAQLPDDRLLLETDAPYLAPTPKRGKRNEPAYLVHTARRLAALKERPLAEIARMTTRNAFRLFGGESESGEEGETPQEFVPDS